MFIINQIVGLLSIAIMCVVMYMLVRGEIRGKTLGIYFLGGIGSLVVGLVVSMLMEAVCPYLEIVHGGPDMFRLFIGAFIGIALPEELAKLGFGLPIMLKGKKTYGIFGTMACFAFVTLGFSAAENIFYVADGDLFTAVNRSIYSAPGHFCYGIFMGYFVGRFRMAARKGDTGARNKFMALAIIVPTCMHGMYDFLFFASETYVYVIFAAEAFFIGMVIFTIVFIVKQYKRWKNPPAPSAEDIVVPADPPMA